MSDSQSVLNSAKRAARLSLATVVMMGLLCPSFARAEDTFTVRGINRSISKIKVTIWDENAGHKDIFHEEMDAGHEFKFDAVKKTLPDLPKKGPGTHISWQVIALTDQGFEFKKDAKRPPPHCGKFMSFANNEKVAVGPFNHADVKGEDCKK
jgi:hypothetical protein